MNLIFEISSQSPSWQNFQEPKNGFNFRFFLIHVHQSLLSTIWPRLRGLLTSIVGMKALTAYQKLVPHQISFDGSKTAQSPGFEDRKRGSI